MPFTRIGVGSSNSGENGNGTKTNASSNIRRNPSVRLGSSGLYYE